MSKVLLPQFEVYTANTSIYENDTNRGQVNPSSLISYLGIKGFGRSNVNQYLRRFPAMFNLAYWDTVKNYYANKQEERAYVITGLDRIWKSISIGDGYVWDKIWRENSSETYEVKPTSQKPIYIKLEFEENISPEEVNEIHHEIKKVLPILTKIRDLNLTIYVDVGVNGSLILSTVKLDHASV